jgi:PilZ domain
MSWLKNLKQEIQKLGTPVQPRAERRPAPGLAVRFALDPAFTPAGVKDISADGIYLSTEKRPPIGELITLIIQPAEGKPEDDSEHQFSIQAQVEREGEDGIGLSFVLPPGLDEDLWDVLVRNITVLTDKDQIANIIRTLRAILFLCRLCPSEAEEAIVLLGGEFDAEHTEALFKIVFATENLLASEPDAERMRAHPKLLANILREGSWAPDELTRQLWTGLLVSSCSTDAPDDSNQVLVNLLIQVTPVQARILSHACQRALGSAPGAGKSPSGSIALNPDEMIRLTGIHDLTRSSTDLAYLYNLGLIQNLFDFTSYREVDSFDITPSSLGLELYKHCHGSRKKVDPQLVEAANAHLLNFLPPPQPITPQTSFLDGQTPPSPLSSSGS